MAKKYKNREEVISTAQIIVDVVCSLERMESDWTEGFKEALKKLLSLSFDEMNEIIGILKAYEEDNKECDEQVKKKQKMINSEKEYGKSEKEDNSQFGDEEYKKGMEFYYQKEFQNAAMCFRSAASKGHIKAEYNYALCLYNGNGLPMNRVEAIKRFVFTSINGIVRAEQILHYIAYGK